MFSCWAETKTTVCVKLGFQRLGLQAIDGLLGPDLRYRLPLFAVVAQRQIQQARRNGMIETAHIALGMSLLTVVLVAIQIFIGRGDKSGGEYRQLAQQVGELKNELTTKFGDVNLQLANLRTELANDALRRAEEMRRTFVPREEYDEHRQLVFFTRDLAKQVHSRMHPDAAIHQPGGVYGPSAG